MPLIAADAGWVADELVQGDTFDLVLVAAIERGQRDAQVAGSVRSALAVIEQALTGSATDDKPTRAIDLLGKRLYARLAD